MTNTNFIGKTHTPTIDRLSARQGYKVVAFLYDEQNQSIRTVSPHYPEKSFPLSADSACRYGHTDFVECGCGFYAYKTAEQALQHWVKECHSIFNFYIIEVALSGQVIVADNGYKASHQRVTKIFMSKCWNCEKVGEGFALHDEGFLVTACFSCARNVVNSGQFSQLFSPEGYRPIQIFSSPDFNDVESLLQPEQATEKIKTAISLLSKQGRNQDIDDVILHAKQSMFDGMFSDTEFDLEEGK